MRVDDKTRWTQLELMNGKVVAAEAKRPFRITRLVGDLGYAATLVVTDGKRSFPLANVAQLEGQVARG